MLAFDRDRLLQTHLAARGWDIVGGHIEPGESPEEAVRREAYEEAGASARPGLLQDGLKHALNALIPDYATALMY